MKGFEGMAERLEYFDECGKKAGLWDEDGQVLEDLST